MWLLFLACSRPPATLEDCDDADCRVQWVVEAWSRSPDEAREALARLDGVEQMVAAEALVEAFPGQTQSLCEVLRGPARTRCEALNQRQHLWKADRPDEMGQELLAPLLPTRRADPWSGLEPLEVPCPDPGADNTCRSEAALEHARAGRPRDAARACQGIAQDTWRQECFFQAADAAFRPPDHGSLPEALELCLGSGPFLAWCLRHTQVELGESAPAIDGPPAAWETTSRRIGELQATLARLLPGLEHAAGQRTWSLAMQTATAGRPPRGTPAGQLPPDALPALRCAVARRLLEERPELDPSQALGRLDQALADHSVVPEALPGSLRPERPRGWERILPGEESLARTVVRGHRWRALSSDARVDSRICLAEAAGITGHDALLASFLADEELLVRWTAARWLQERERSALLSTALDDPDPRVRARAQFGVDGSE